MLVAGVDVGAATAKAVVLRDRELAGWAVLPTGGYVVDSASEVLEKALAHAGASMDQVEFICSTGYARKSIPFAKKAASEILCHAKGVHHLHPEVRTIIDIGGQDSKIISLKADGSVADFVMNDKCAAGTGRFLEIMARTLNLDVDDMGAEALKGTDPVKFHTACTTFIETELVSYRAAEAPRADMVAGVMQTVARRVGNMGGMLGYRDAVALTGGVARNIAMAPFLEARIGRPVIVPELPQLMGALGAALIADETAARQIEVSAAK